MTKKYILFIFFITMFAHKGRTQDLVYSQYYAAPMQLNPAFAGNTIAPFININYRRNWSSFPVAYESYGVGYSQFFENINSGLGFTATADDAGEGIIKTNRFTGVFAYKLQASREVSIKLGIEAGIISSTLDWDRLLFYDQIDEIEGPTGAGGNPFPSGEVPPQDLTQNLLDISTGILVYSKQFYGGLSLHRINTPNDSYLNINNNLYSGYPMRASVHAGMQIPIGQRSRQKAQAFISPNVLYTHQRDFAQLNAGTYLSLGPIFLGAWYRHAFTNPDAIIASFGVQQSYFKIGYSYDLTISNALNSRTGGSHEVSIIMNFDTNRKYVDYNDCFDVFR